MTTTLTRNVKRKVVTQRQQPLVVTLAREGIWLREPRRRVAYLLPYEFAFLHAVKLYVAAERQRKQAERRARRATRSA